MKENRLFNAVLATLTGLILSASNISQAQNPPPRSVVFSEVVKLSQAHQSDDVILGYLQNSGAPSYALSADEIIYLNNQGVSQKVIGSLQSHGVAPVIPAAPTVPAAPVIAPPPGIPGTPVAPGVAVEANFNTFHDKLAVDGTWVDVPGYGQCWRPAVLTDNPDWRPYYDGGHWVYTDDGWYWQSDRPWGNIVFHYGRWTLNPRFGWVWIPGYDYGPSWVCWRHSEGYLGWAPLPPEARFEVGVGLTFHGRVGVDVDFGLDAGFFTFVGYDHFWEHDFRRFVVPRDRVVVIFRGSRLQNDFRVEHGRFINEGIGHERIAGFTHHEVRVERVERVGFHDRAVVVERERVVPGRGESDHREGRDSRDRRDRP